MSVAAERKFYTVSQVNGLIHDLLEESFSDLWVEGEISNCRTYPSGHTYLTLKDENSQIPAVLFKGAAMGVKFKLEDGLKVLARARISSYVKRGDVQLILSAVEPREAGALQLALEQLKKKLAAEGLFDPARKKPIPPYPQRVGLVTSLQGAAVRDMLTVLERRWNGLSVSILPVRVQGDEAAGEISRAIADFNRCYPETDVLLVGRGGGSIEDLWAFNEEVVARAIADSAIPIIACVGHETDTTIADLVADVRAPTPSAAAELAVPEKRQVLEEIAALRLGLREALAGRVSGLEQRLSYVRRHPKLLSPRWLYEEPMRRLDELTGRLQETARAAMDKFAKEVGLRAARLEALSPLGVLSRGFALAEKMPGGELLVSADQVKAGDVLRVRLKKGQVACEVKNHV